MHRQTGPAGVVEPRRVDEQDVRSYREAAYGVSQDSTFARGE
jgi:hypothetical protein